MATSTPPKPAPTSNTLTSQDGTPIHYLTAGGSGPGLVILHGAMESAPSHLELAQALSSTYTVYLPSRRGRAPSGAPGENYGMATELADLTALVERTGARYLMGVSSGALIALAAVKAGVGGVEKVVLFEPPLVEVNEEVTKWMTRYETEMSAGKTSAALVTGMLGTEMGPPFMRYIPRWLLERMTTWMMSRDEATNAGKERGSEDPMSFRDLAPTLRQDFTLVRDMDLRNERTLGGCGGIMAEVLLLGGTESPVYLQRGLDRLEEVLTDKRRVRMDGAGHGATGNTDRRGLPEKAARVLREFLG